MSIDFNKLLISLPDLPMLPENSINYAVRFDLSLFQHIEGFPTELTFLQWVDLFGNMQIANTPDLAPVITALQTPAFFRDYRQITLYLRMPSLQHPSWPVLLAYCMRLTGVSRIFIATKDTASDPRGLIWLYEELLRKRLLACLAAYSPNCRSAEVKFVVLLPEQLKSMHGSRRDEVMYTRVGKTVYQTHVITVAHQSASISQDLQSLMY